MNKSRGCAFVLLSALMLLKFIHISLGAPNRNPSEKSAQATDEEKLAVVSDIMPISKLINHKFLAKYRNFLPFANFESSVTKAMSHCIT